MKLQEKWECHGEQIPDFKNAIAEMDSATKVQICRSRDLQILSLVRSTAERFKFVIVGHIASYAMVFADMIDKVPNAMRQAFGHGEVYVTDLVSKSSPELVKEFETETRYLLSVEGKRMFASPFLYSTLASKIGVGGERINLPSLARDMLVQENLERDIPLSLVIRTGEHGEEKVFAAHSGKYLRIEQKVLSEVIDILSPSMGKAECHSWEVNNRYSEIYLSFPEKAEEFQKYYKLPAKLIPGLHLSISDTGERSLTVRGTWLLRKSLCGEASFARKHSGEIEPKELLDEIEKKIFARYNKVPEALAKLLTIDVPNPASTIRRLTKSIGLVKAIGIKIANQVRDRFIADLNPAAKYTAYDIAMMYLGLPESLTGLTASAKENLSNTVINAVFAKYEETTTEEDEDVVLLPN